LNGGVALFKLPAAVRFDGALPHAMDAWLISVISACTALVASIVGPFVTLAVARRQFNATVLSANRQKWIEASRDLLTSKPSRRSGSPSSNGNGSG